MHKSWRSCTNDITMTGPNVIVSQAFHLQWATFEPLIAICTYLMYTYHNISSADEYHQPPLGSAFRPQHLSPIPPCQPAPQCNKVVWVEKKSLKNCIRCKPVTPTTIWLSRKAFELCRLLQASKFDHKHTRRLWCQEIPPAVAIVQVSVYDGPA